MTSRESAEEKPVISVCIANYNGEGLLTDCLSSIQAQDFPGPVEILVHDDASTDHSLEILATRYPDVLVIASKDNVGYCKANNRLAERARGDYLLLLNNDAALRQSALLTLIRLAEATAGPTVSTLPQYDWNTGYLVDLGMRLDLLHTPVANCNEECGRLAYVQGACMFLRRDVWIGLGGFPEWMVSNVEDTYLCALVRLRGGRILVANESGYDHRQGASFGGNRIGSAGLTTTYRRRYLSERNRACLVFVCTPTWVAWPLYAVHLAFLLLEGALVSLAKLDTKAWRRIYWSAVRDSLAIFGQLRRSRDSVQAARKIGLWDYLRVLDPVPHKLMLLIKYGLPRFK